MTTRFNGRGFATPANTTFKTPFEGTFGQREKAVSTVMARRYARRSRRENRAL